MMIGQIAAILAASDGRFHLVDSIIEKLFGASVGTGIFFLLMRYREPTVLKPEKIRRKVGADLGEFADVPPPELDRLLTITAKHLSRIWLASWPPYAVMFISMAGFGVFYDYAGSIGWSYYTRVGLPLTAILLVSLVSRPFVRPIFRRKFLRELRRLRAAPAVSA